MAAGIPATPWIQAPDVAQHWSQGYGLGLQAAQEQNQIAIAQQKMAQQAQQQQVELEMQQRQADQKARMEQAQIETAKAYHTAQVGIAQGKLQEAQQMNQMKVQQAAQIASVKMQAQQRIAKGEDPSQVWMELGPQAGMGMGGIGSLANAQVRAKQAAVPKNLEINKQAEGTFYRSSPTEPYKIVPGGSEDRVMQHQPAIEAFKELGRIEADYRAADKKKKPELQEQIDATKRRINDIYQNRKMGIQFPEVAGSGKKRLDHSTAMWFLNESKGDKDKARQLAKDAGYEF